MFVPPASPTVGDLRIFPSFRWFGKCNSSGGKPQRLHSNRLPPACYPFCQADRHRLSGQNGNGLKSCGSHMGLSAICSANRDKSPSEASQSTEGALSPNLQALPKSMIWCAGLMQRSLCSFLRLRLRCPACLANRLAALCAGWQAPQRFSAWRCTARFGREAGVMVEF